MADGTDVPHDRAATDSEPLLDGLTGLPSSAAWREILRVEESRRRRYGGLAGMVLVEVAGNGPAGGEDLVVAGEMLTLAVRETDPVCRVGDRRFAVLAVPCEGGVDGLAARLRRLLAHDSIPATVTARIADAGETLTETWEALDRTAGRPLRSVK